MDSKSAASSTFASLLCENNSLARQISDIVLSRVPSASDWLCAISPPSPDVTDATEVHSDAKLGAYFDDTSKRLIILDCASNLLLANKYAGALQSLIDSYSSTTLTGLMITGTGDWDVLFRNPDVNKVFTDNFPMPVQSYTLPYRSVSKRTEETEGHVEKTHMENMSYSVKGIACWTGRGLTRTDRRQHLWQTGVGPGEGSIRVDQVVQELLSNIGAVPRFGA